MQKVHSRLVIQLYLLMIITRSVRTMLANARNATVILCQHMPKPVWIKEFQLMDGETKLKTAVSYIILIRDKKKTK